MATKRKKPQDLVNQAHALTTLLRGATGAVNRRKNPFRAAEQWVLTLARGLGGELTAFQASRLGLVEKKAQRLFAYYGFIGPEMQAKGGLALLNSKRRAPYALTSWVDGAEDSLLKLLAALEATKAPKPVQSLEAHVAKHYGKKRRPVRAKPAPASSTTVEAPPAPADQAVSAVRQTDTPAEGATP